LPGFSRDEELRNVTTTELGELQQAYPVSEPVSTMNSRPLKALFIKEQKLKDNRDEELSKLLQLN
jgi:hypothetical protein